MAELQARSRQPRRGIYILPTLFTIGTIFCGFYAVINTMKGEFDLAGQAAHLARRVVAGKVDQDLFHFAGHERLAEVGGGLDDGGRVLDRDRPIGQRGHGVGAQLVQWVIERARTHGCRLVQLTTDKRRPDALRFYESLGFRATHEGLKLHL